MMHPTLHAKVKGKVDNYSHDGKTLSLWGWAFHEKLDVIPLRLHWIIEGKDLQTFELKSDKRTDVGDYYERPSVEMCGFNFVHGIGHGAGYIEAHFDETWNVLFNIAPSGGEAIGDSVSAVNDASYKTFVVVDNFYKNPNAIREFALKCTFAHHKDYHKGKRTEKSYLFPELKGSFERILGKKIKDWTPYSGTNGCFQICMGGDQLVYHCDKQEYAGVLFLTPDAPPATGTSFFRSKHTKKMKVNSNEHVVVFRNGFLDPTEFDLVDTVGNVYNRLVLFDARLIHAASSYFGNNDNNSRLFQLFFFDLEVGDQ